MPHFSGLRILITGSGSGIGALMAEKLALEGAEVIVTARRKIAAEEVRDRILRHGGTAHAMVLDVSKHGTFTAFRERLHKAHGPVDILINNAGVVFGGEFERVDIKEHLNTFQINATGLMALTHAFFGDLIQSPKGHLVNIASASSYVGLPYGSTYAASKWAVLGFSESLRLELKERGLDHVAVTTVCPSYIDTGMFDGVRAPLLSPMLSPEKVVRSILRGIREREALVQEPMIVKHIDLMKGTLPMPVWDFLAKTTGMSTSMKKWRGKH
jgi:all-trans-retinol dehydrogenase (NAD+)